MDVDEFAAGFTPELSRRLLLTNEISLETATILETLLSMKIFTTGRCKITTEIGKFLAGQVTRVFLITSNDDIMEYLGIRQDENETQNEMYCT